MSTTMGGQRSSSQEQFCLSDAFYKCFGLWGRNDSATGDSSVNKNVICCCCQKQTVKRKQPSAEYRRRSNGSCNSEHLNEEEFSREVCTSNNIQESTCCEESKAAIKALLINGEVKSRVSVEHSQLEAANNERNMTIDNTTNVNEANDNYLPSPCLTKDMEQDKLNKIYDTLPHIEDVVKSNGINRPTLTERYCEEEITPMLKKTKPASDEDDVIIKDDDDTTTKSCCDTNKENNTSAASVSYFRNLVRTERQKLNKPLEFWQPFLTDDACPSHGKDEIRTVIGQTNLVIKERFTQFSRLIDQADRDHENYKTERPVLMPDLQGFWDMVYFQVEDVTAKFADLQKLKESNWERKSTPKQSAKPNTPKPKSTQSKAKKAKPQLSEEDRKRREAARKRIADARKAMAEQRKILRAKTSASDTSMAATLNDTENELEIKKSTSSKSDIVLTVSNTDTSSPCNDASMTSLRTMDSVTCGNEVTVGLVQTPSGLVI